MNEKRLAALRRKLATFERAGLKKQAARTRARLEAYEAEVADAPEPEKVAPVAEPEAEAEEAVGVTLTPAAQALADELGVTADDLRDHEPSGKDGGFLVSDIRRIAEAKAHTEEDDNDGDD